jgi:hypothetical protein
MVEELRFFFLIYHREKFNLIFLPLTMSLCFYSVFHRFRQAEISNSGLIFEFKPIFATAPVTYKNEADF